MQPGFKTPSAKPAENEQTSASSCSSISFTKGALTRPDALLPATDYMKCFVCYDHNIACRMSRGVIGFLCVPASVVCTEGAIAHGGAGVPEQGAGALEVSSVPCRQLPRVHPSAVAARMWLHGQISPPRQQLPQHLRAAWLPALTPGPLLLPNGQDDTGPTPRLHLRQDGHSQVSPPRKHLETAIFHHFWGYSSDGRVYALHASGQRFKPITSKQRS